MGFIYYKKLIKVYKVFNNNRGSNNINYITIAVIGDKNGGLGIGKSSNLNQATSNSKALLRAKSNFFKVGLKNKTIPYPIVGKSCRCLIYFYPLRNIYNFSCGSYARSILDVMGIYNISVKINGSSSFCNIINATLNALKSIISPSFIFRKRHHKNVFKEYF